MILESESKPHPERAEHTQLGLAIGSLRESVFGAPSEHVRAEQARQNDDVAHLVADVVATLPHVRWLAAGATRAVLLHDPNPTDKYQVLGDTARNFLGGAAMNSILRSSSYGFIQREAAARYGFGATGQAANYFGTGVALGVVRGYTDDRYWRDENGDFAFPDLGAMVRSGMMIGVANIPAGFAGSNLASFAGRSPGFFARVGTGIAAGGMSGGTFGATDSLVRNGDLSEASQRFVGGMLIGGITGGAIAGAERTRQDAFYFVGNKLRKPPIEEDTTGPIIGSGTPGNHPRNLDFTADIRPLSALHSELGKPQQSTYTAEVLNPFGPVRFWSRYQFSKNLFEQVRPAEVYEAGNTKIVVPSDYAGRLNEVRQLRLTALGGSDQSQTALSQHPLKARLLPEEVLPLLDRIPDRTKVKEVQLLGYADPWNRYYQEFYDWGRVQAANGKSFVAAADASKATGMIRFYEAPKENWSKPVQPVMDHEQVHLNHDPHYPYARQLDKKGETSKYGYFNNKESEAELESMAFFGPTPAFVEATQQAPIRMSLLAAKLSHTLRSAKDAPSTSLETLANRIAYIKENVTPEAGRTVKEVADKARSEGRGYTYRSAMELYVRLNPDSPEAAAFLNSF